MNSIKRWLSRLQNGQIQTVSIRVFLSLLVGMAVLTCLFGILFWSNTTSQSNEVTPWQQESHTILTNESSQLHTIEQTSQNFQSVQAVIVDIKGAVQHPGVYELKSEDRIQHVIEAAGGFTEDADQSVINLAQKVTDQMMIVVPLKGTGTSTENATVVTTPEATNLTGVQSKDAVVNLNTATAEQLQTLAGIGQKKAEQIIAYRQEHGPFQKVEDLANVPGFGERTVERLKDAVTVQ